MLKNFGIIAGDPMPVLENYFRQCSIRVTCRDLAYMAATLANSGVHPVTGKRAVPAEEVQTVLSIMATCGMYDYAGSWVRRRPARQEWCERRRYRSAAGRFGIAIFRRGSMETATVSVASPLQGDIAQFDCIFGVDFSIAGLGRIYSAQDAPSRRIRSAAIAARLRPIASHQVLRPARRDRLRWRRISSGNCCNRTGGGQLHPRHASGQLRPARLSARCTCLLTTQGKGLLAHPRPVVVEDALTRLRTAPRAT
jgi:hypothetical protein